MAADGKHPKFQRLNYGAKKRVKAAWRMPHGIDSKQRIKLKWAGALPAIGYRGKKANRDLHPCGLHEIIVHNAKEVLALAGKKVCGRIAATVGKKKREELAKIASEKAVKLLN
ncbi:MAG: eL32 family ribosomal protein [Candidatus Micrarchaeia archaeon]|jgi:large subunit ribosomal protein L32e